MRFEEAPSGTPPPSGSGTPPPAPSGKPLATGPVALVDCKGGGRRRYRRRRHGHGHGGHGCGGRGRVDPVKHWRDLLM